MKNKIKILTILFSIIFLGGFAQGVHHNLNVDLNIKHQSISVVDTITYPAGLIKPGDVLTFTLNRNLTLSSLSEYYTITEAKPEDGSGERITYAVTYPPSKMAFLEIPVEYSGKITGDIEQGAAEYARGFSDTDGIIADAGVYLAGSTYWVPSFREPLFTYDLTVELRKDWNVVSQGKRTIDKIQDGKRLVKYECPNPTEEVYLISAGWTEYSQKAGDVLVEAFLRTPDSALAERYLGATSGYLDMYVELLGPYPYTKFALVENFWETGYGMPSFTLLGEKIIRFPFILYSSYPHELLHNWWGNSVYVDWDSGNWCEGLTAYMADHLLKEQRGQGAAYRRTTLQKFTDYVNNENDFPVVDFRNRSDAAEEAIGYGKCLMFNHMLRQKTGSLKYIDAYRDFYKENKFKIASFDDILASFKKTTGEDYTVFFDQWLKRKGAPEIKLSNVNVEKVDGNYKLAFSLAQLQKEDVFEMEIPVAVYLKNEVKVVNVSMDQRKKDFVFNYFEAPVKIVIDPRFDVFRRLDKAETPPSLSQVFGTREGMIVLPKNSEMFDGYSMLAETWKQTQEAQGKSLEIVFDSDLKKIPEGKAVWVIGFKNKFANTFSVQKDYASVFSEKQINQINTLEHEGSLVYAIPNGSSTMGFVGTNVKEAVPGLTRLLSHYGKYSYLGFEGGRPNNILKGSFPAKDSPLQFVFKYDGKTLKTSARLEASKALID
ncbi:MAG: hypothetical protein GXO89_11130 [Chlorobi bacterium]|nr:hypothetical protein [Chlorobiota bacterium]